MEAVTHWDDLPAAEHDVGPMRGRWTTIAGARLGANRIEVAPDRQATPAHRHGAEEELFYVLGGEGLWWEDGAAFRIAQGDCVLAPVLGPAHTIIGPADVLAFGPRIDAEVTYLPAAKVARIGGVTVRDVTTRHQWLFDADAGPVERVAPGERPAHCVNVIDVEADAVDRPPSRFASRKLHPAVGATRTKLRWLRVEPGARAYPRHCHSMEEELFVVLGGGGEAEVGGERHPLRRGSVVSRPAGTGVPHTFFAGDEGLELLAYSDSHPGDSAYLPDSGKVYLRGLGILARVEPVGYWD